MLAFLGGACLSGGFAEAKPHNLESWLTFGIGNQSQRTIYFSQGQAFTPSEFGNDATPQLPDAPPTTVFLTSFRFHYPDVGPAGYGRSDRLFIYASPPTVEDARSGAGSMATGTYVEEGFSNATPLYTFDHVELAFSTKYYVVFPGITLVRAVEGNAYSGGAMLCPCDDVAPGVVDENSSDLDIGFRATFEYRPACPADLNYDGLVDDPDIAIFAVAYDTLVCTDPAMAPGCPSDFNADDAVDDLDFQTFVFAYNQLLYP